MRHGRDWERQGWVSFFEGGPADVHGERRRARPWRRQPPDVAAARVPPVLPASYGAKELPAGIAFQGAHAHPVRRLILHNDVRVGAHAAFAGTC